MKVVIIALVSILVTASAHASIYSMNAVQKAEQATLESPIPELSATEIIESTDVPHSTDNGTLYTGPDADAAQPTGEYLA